MAASDRYWVGGTATWDATAGTKWANASGGAGGQTVPGSGNDVFFDAASTGTCTTSGARSCRSLNMTASGCTLSHAASSTITIGDGTAGASNVALKLIATKYSAVNTTTSAFVFASTNATQQTIDFGTNTMGNLTFNGAGGSWLFNDNLTARSTTATVMDILAGTVNFNGKTISYGKLTRSAETGTATLTFGAASVTLGNATAPLVFGTSTSNLTMNRNTATITISGNTVTVTLGSGLTWPSFSIAAAQVPFAIGGGSSTRIATLTWTGSAAQNNSMQFTSDMTIDTLVVQGNSAPNRVLLNSDTLGTTRTLSIGAVTTAQDIDFRDITVTGAASPLAGTRLGDFQGNSGITFTSGNKFLVSGNVNTTWASSNHWATATGGATSLNNYPLPQDMLVIDGNTGWTAARSVTITANQRHSGIDASAMTQDWTVTGGDFIVVNSMKFSSSKATIWASNFGVTWRHRGTTKNLTFGGSGTSGLQNIATSTDSTGNITMLDAIALNASVKPIYNWAGSGTFDGGTFSHNFGIYAHNQGGLTFGTANVSFYDTCNIGQVAAATCSTSNTTFVFPNPSAANASFFIGQNMTLAALTIDTSATALPIGGINGPITLTVGALNITAPRTINWNDSATATAITIALGSTGTMTAVGSSGNVITFGTVLGGALTSSAITKTAGTVYADWLSLTNNKVSGGAGFYAGRNSTSGGGNTGWIMGPPGAQNIPMTGAGNMGTAPGGLR